MINGIFFRFLLKVILFAFIALILYGVVPDLALILILFVVWRFSSLVVEAFRKPASAGQWDTMRDGLTRMYERFTPEQRAHRAIALKFDSRLSARELAQAQVDKATQSYRPPRPKRELTAEALGVIAFAILIPLDIALYTSEIFSFRASHRWGWEGAIVAAICLGLYAWPNRALKSPDASDVRIWWWVLPFAIALLAMFHAVQTRHPYLNPFNPDRDRLAAERVLSLKNNVVAGYYADWVLRYARELDQRGDTASAIHFYREGLRLDANNHQAAMRLAQLESQSGATVESQTIPSSSAPYWTAASPVTKSPRQRIDSGLEDVEECTVVIVPVGDVPDNLLDTVGYVIHNELNLPVCISPDPVPIPPYTRKRGLATEPQWDVDSLIRAFTNATPVFPRAPVKFLLLTTADIYIQDANYVFSSSSRWGAVLSSARFAGSNGDISVLRQRTAKQALCAMLKSFDIPASTDRNCVTSYVRDLPEFDAKGNRPDAETMKLFQQAVSVMNQRWLNYRAVDHTAAK